MWGEGRREELMMVQPAFAVASALSYNSINVLDYGTMWGGCCSGELVTVRARGKAL
jgi:hypothetical protein